MTPYSDTYAETNVPAEEAPPRQDAWLPVPNEHEAGEEGSLPPTDKGTKESDREKGTLGPMLPKEFRLRHEKDFARLSVKGRPLYGPYCVLRAWKSGSDPSKIGFVASGKRFKKATERNAIRRKMREAFRPFLKDVTSGYDMIFVAQPEIRKADFAELQNSVKHLVEKMPTELEKPMKRRPKPPKSRKGIIQYSKQIGTPRPPGKRAK